MLNAHVTTQMVTHLLQGMVVPIMPHWLQLLHLQVLSMQLQLQAYNAIKNANCKLGVLIIWLVLEDLILANVDLLEKDVPLRLTLIGACIQDLDTLSHHLLMTYVLTLQNSTISTSQLHTVLPQVKTLEPHV
jgi:hypothetical protein